MGKQEEHHDIVIVGGGICGLGTALALHRKGINSLVLERSDTLRATGASISVYLNGWHALDQLGVGAQLRANSIPITEIHDESVYKEGTEVIPIRDRIDALLDDLIMNTKKLIKATSKEFEKWR